MVIGISVLAAGLVSFLPVRGMRIAGVIAGFGLIITFVIGNWIGIAAGIIGAILLIVGKTFGQKVNYELL